MICVLLEDDVACEEAIVEENEQLSEGMPVSAVVTENHEDHIRGHQSVISKPNAKKDPELVQNVLMHIQEHITMWNDASMNNPALLLATGQKVLPPAPQQGMPPGPGGPPPGAQLPPGPPPPQSPEIQGGPEARQPSLPKPPADPLTGERAPVQPGTSVS